MRLSSETGSQRDRLLSALLERPVSTLDAKNDLDILSPAPRVLELRRKGFNIATHWHYEDTGKGRHKIGVYTLLNS